MRLSVKKNAKHDFRASNVPTANLRLMKNMTNLLQESKSCFRKAKLGILFFSFPLFDFVTVPREIYAWIFFFFGQVRTKIRSFFLEQHWPYWYWSETAPKQRKSRLHYIDHLKPKLDLSHMPLWYKHYVCPVIQQPSFFF